MEVTGLVSELDDFGEARAVGLERDCIVFELECEIDSINVAESLIERIDNISGASLSLTGKNGKSLWIIQVPQDHFNTIPPYLMDNWTE